MHSFFNLYFFSYCPSRFKVDLNRYFSSRVKSNSLYVTNLTHSTRTKSIENTAQVCPVQFWTEWDNGTGLRWANFGSSQEHSCDFLFSVNNTTEVAARTSLGELTALPRPPSWWVGGSSPPYITGFSYHPTRDCFNFLCLYVCRQKLIWLMLVLHHPRLGYFDDVWYWTFCGCE